MEKVLVIGCPGAGKSYFARRLKNVTKLPLYYLDMIYHNKDGTHILKEELEEKIKSIIDMDNWIIDGNYQRTLDLRLQKCDTVFLLDFPTDICINGAKGRIGTKREDLPWVEKFLDKEFEKYILEFSKEKLPKIYLLLEK